MRELKYVEKVQEVDRRDIFVCYSCQGAVSYQKCSVDNIYKWICNRCGKTIDVQDLKIKIGDVIKC